MAEDKGDENWSPKTRDDWKGLFTDAFKDGMSGLLSDREEKEAKGESEKGSEKEGNDKDGKSNGASKSFAERLLGL